MRAGVEVAGASSAIGEGPSGGGVWKNEGIASTARRRSAAATARRGQTPVVRAWWRLPSRSA